MATSDVHVDPERLRAIAEELSMFSGDVSTDLALLTSALDKLGRTWQDEEFRRFKSAVQPLRGILEQFHQEILRSKPALLADAEAIRSYQRLQAP